MGHKLTNIIIKSSCFIYSGKILALSRLDFIIPLRTMGKGER